MVINGQFDVLFPSRSTLSFQDLIINEIKDSVLECLTVINLEKGTKLVLLKIFKNLPTTSNGKN